LTPPRCRYRTDLTDAQWRVLEPLIPAPKPGGRPPVHQRRELLNAMLYRLRAGCAWRLLLHDLPPWQTVYHYFRRWRLEGRWEQILRVLRVKERLRQGRRPTPQRRHLGQPKRQDHRKGAHTATTAPRRSTAAAPRGG
jgi:putative transposase